MKALQRIKNYTQNSILCKIEIDKQSKLENKLFVEALTKDGDIVSTTIEKISTSDVKKIVELFDSKLKKFAWLNTTPVYLGHEFETQMFINPELMEKERVGFELYGMLSDKSANTDLVAYYSFSDSELDFRQPLIHDNIFGFFSLTNFETPYNGLKATLNEYGITYKEIDNVENYQIIMTLPEFERQYNKKEEIESPKRKRKTTEKVSPEIAQLKKTLNSIKEVKITNEEKIIVNIPSTEISQKRGRGRPPKNK